MTPPGDLRAWIALLEREGELVRVSAEVDPDLEITEITDRVVKAGGPALLFENVKGSSHPLLINQFGTERRMCMAFGAPTLDDVARAARRRARDAAAAGARREGEGAPEAEVDRRLAPEDGARRAARRRSCSPATTSTSTCSRSSAAGRATRRRSSRCPAVITHDPRTGSRNVGMYRMQKVDRRTTLMHWQIHKDGRADYLFADGRLEVAVALGLDPVSAYSASAPLPKHIDEFMLAGFLKGSPVELVPREDDRHRGSRERRDRARGLRRAGRPRAEGPFGDHTGYYTAVEPFPVFHVTAITMRRDAIYPSIVVGKPPQEDAWLGKATERIFLPAIRMSVPELVDYDLPVAGAFHNCCIVSIRKQFPGHAQKVMHAIWGLGLLSLTKSVVVVDEDVDVHDYEEVFFRVCANVDPKRDVLITEGPLDHLDHAPTLQFYGGKLGIDATHKGPAEGTREWPPEIEMSDEVRALVDEPLGGVRDRARSRGTGRANSSKCVEHPVWCIVDRGTESRPTTVRPGPSLWPIGFALGVACVLVGLIVSWPVAAVGGAIALIAGGVLGPGLDQRLLDAAVEHEPETRAARDAARARANAAGPDARAGRGRGRALPAHGASSRARRSASAR